MKANQKWGHFNGSITCPIPANVDKPTDDKKTAMADWDRSESVMLYMLSQRLPDSTAVRLQSITTVADCWAKVTGEFSVKSQYTKIDLLSTFSKMRCSTISEVWTFLGQMRMKREELAAIGISMTPKDYQTAILKAIPEEMSKFASRLLTTSHMFAPTTQIDLDILIDHICEESDRLAMQRKDEKSAKGQGQQGGAQDEVLAATGKGERHKHKGKCHNCGKPGY
jgi:hypothetical protein